jgi:hypothetical protein
MAVQRAILRDAIGTETSNCTLLIDRPSISVCPEIEVASSTILPVSWSGLRSPTHLAWLAHPTGSRPNSAYSLQETAIATASSMHYAAVDDHGLGRVV